MKRRIISCAATLALLSTMLLTTVPASAAIPCIDQPILYSTVSLPPSTAASTLSVEDLLAGPNPTNESVAASPDASPEVQSGDSAPIRAPLENVVRCILYEDYTTLATVVTGDYRASHMGAELPESAPDRIEGHDGLRLLMVTESSQPDESTMTGRAELLLDGNRLLIVDVTFVNIDGNWYLSDSVLLRNREVDNTVLIGISESGVTVSSDDFPATDVTSVHLDLEQSAIYEYTLVAVNGDQSQPVREGTLVGPGYAGPPDDSVMVLHDLEPGIYEFILEPEDAPVPDAAPVVVTLGLT